MVWQTQIFIINSPSMLQILHKKFRVAMVFGLSMVILSSQRCIRVVSQDLLLKL